MGGSDMTIQQGSATTVPSTAGFAPMSDKEKEALGKAIQEFSDGFGGGQTKIPTKMSDPRPPDGVRAVPTRARADRGEAAHGAKCVTDRKPDFTSVVGWVSNIEASAPAGKVMMVATMKASAEGRHGDAALHAIGGGMEAAMGIASTVCGEFERICSLPMHAAIFGLENAKNVGEKIGYGILCFLSAFLLVGTFIGMVFEALFSPLRALGKLFNFTMHEAASATGRAEYKAEQEHMWKGAGPFGPLFDCFDNPFTAETECEDLVTHQRTETPAKSFKLRPSDFL